MDDKTLKSYFTNFTDSCGILNLKEYGEVYTPKEILIKGLNDRLNNPLVIKRSDDPADIPSEQDETVLTETGGQVVMQDIENGFKIVFGHKLLFSSGSAEINEDMKYVLEPVATFMNASAYQLYIDGHTDNIPINTEQYQSNDDLSLARAMNIMGYLVNEQNVDGHAVAVSGYGEHHPVGSNETDTGRNNNRRVEMIFKNKRYF
jgi:chemotaxis protein MotB